MGGCKAAAAAVLAVVAASATLTPSAGAQGYPDRPVKLVTQGAAGSGPDVIGRIVENVDVLVGNEEDLQKALDIPGPATEGVSATDPGAFLRMMESVIARYPGIKAVATTLREVHSANRHTWSAVAWLRGQTYTAPKLEVDVYDRVGGGDGFSSGFFYGLLTGVPLEAAVKLGWAHGALLTTYPGDTTMATLKQVRALAAGGSSRIER